MSKLKQGIYWGGCQPYKKREHGIGRYSSRYTPDALSREGVGMRDMRDVGDIADMLSRVQSCDTSCAENMGHNNQSWDDSIVLL